MNRLNSEELVKLTKALIGRTYPIGETNMDKEGLSNLKIELDLIDNLLTEVMNLVKYRNRSEYSIEVIGNEAYDQIKQWNKELNDFIEEWEYDNEIK